MHSACTSWPKPHSIGSRGARSSPSAQMQQNPSSKHDWSCALRTAPHSGLGHPRHCSANTMWRRKHSLQERKPQHCCSCRSRSSSSQSGHSSSVRDDGDGSDVAAVAKFAFSHLRFPCRGTCTEESLSLSLPAAWTNRRYILHCTSDMPNFCKSRFENFGKS